MVPLDTFFRRKSPHVQNHSWGGVASPNLSHPSTNSTIPLKVTTTACLYEIPAHNFSSLNTL